MTPTFLSRLRARLTMDTALRFIDALAGASVGFPPLTPAELEWIRFAYEPAAHTLHQNAGMIAPR